MTMTQDRLRRALFDPASVFSSPMAAANELDFSAKDKIEILRRWEYDALEVLVAVEEGSPALEPNTLLDAVLIALHQLDTGPDIEHTPPTKHGGV